MMRIHLKIDVRMIRLLLALFHLSLAAVSLWRHNMVEIIPGYAGFAAVAPTTTWGFLATIIATGLLFIKRGTPLLVVWQFFSATYFVTFSTLVSAVYGITWGTAAYLFPAIMSYIVMWGTLEEVFESNTLMSGVRAKIIGRRDV